MKNYTMTKKLGGLAAGVLLSGGLLAAALSPQPAQAHGDVQHKTITITEKGYSPSSVSVKSGQKTELIFVSKGGGCANGVSIPALKQNFTLKKGQKKTVTFMPKKGQTINFACSMKMFKGKVTAK